VDSSEPPGVGRLAVPRGVPLPRIRIVGLVVLALFAGSCTSATPRISPIATTSVGSPSTSPNPAPATYPITTVGPVQLLSRTFGVVAVSRCRAPEGACHQHLLATEDLGRNLVLLG